MSTQAAQARPRSLSGSVIVAGLAGYGAFWLGSFNAPGQDWAGIAALVLGLVGLSNLVSAANIAVARARVNRAERAARTVRKTQGSARWGTLADARAAGMLKPGGFFIGRLDGRDVYHNGEGSAFVFAPPGAGKTTSSVIPQLLLRHRDDRGRPASMVVFDLKSELYAVCAAAMRRLGYWVVAIAPWASSMGEELGIEIEDAGYNPLLPLLKAGDEARDLAHQLAEQLLPGSKNETGSSEFFLDFGRMILAWGLLVLARENDPAKLNLVELRRLLMRGGQEFDDLLAETCYSDAFGGALAEDANKLASTKIDAPEQWSGAINTATKALKIYDGFGPLSRHVSVTNGFDFATVKDQPTCVFIICPAERATTHTDWVNLTVSSAVERAASDRTTRRVLFLLDEFINIGYLRNILKYLGLYRGQGIQFAFYAQTASQVERVYGREGLRDLLGMCELIQAFAVRDPETLRMLSELAGQDTVREVSHGLQRDLSGTASTPGYSNNSAAQGRPILRPEDIRTLPGDRQLAIYRNLPVFLMKKVSYLLRRRWRRAAAPNPYHAR